MDNGANGTFLFENLYSRANLRVINNRSAGLICIFFLNHYFLVELFFY